MSVPDPERHRRILGYCWIIYGILRVVMAICLVLFRATATLMFGSLLSRVPDPFTLMSVFHLMYIGAIVLSALCGIFGLLAGIALLTPRAAGRTLALAAAFLSLSNLPLGTTLGIYTLVVYLP